jgi:hypothetical protein
MRIYLLSLAILFCSMSAFAQKDRPNKTHFIVNLGADYQLNGADVQHERVNKHIMQAKNTLGGRLGGEFRKYGSKNLLWLQGLTLR